MSEIKPAVRNGNLALMLESRGGEKYLFKFLDSTFKLLNYY